MKVFVATEYRIIKNENRYFAYAKFATILKRYSYYFGKLTICTRLGSGDVNDNRLLEISDCLEQVIPTTLVRSFVFLDYYTIKSEIAKCDLIIGRFDSIVSCRAAKCARVLGKPFFAELMADAWDGYWNHGLLGKLLAPYMFYTTRRAVAKANYALYVTEQFLQKRYPCKCKSINASNVCILKIDICDLERRIERIKKMDMSKLVLLTTAAVDVTAKGQEYVVKSIPELKKKGIDIEYRLIGKGDSTRLKKIAEKYGVLNHIRFLGELPLHDVFIQIEDADIYVQPSLQEGLPRAVIEAMSKGCPCLGARTAGIPELLSEECIFERKSPISIVEAILRVSTKDFLEKCATQNIYHSMMYHNDILEKRRAIFYEEIKSDLDRCS